MVLESERRYRNSMDLLRSVIMSRLNVLGHDLATVLFVSGSCERSCGGEELCGDA